MKHYIKGNLLGKGCSRNVYSCVNHPEWVIKEKSMNSVYWLDENYLEYLNYINFKRYNLHYWLSPCFYQSDKLYMKKIVGVNKIITKVPEIFDYSINNWGLLDNFPVCIDYDFILSSSLKHKKINSYIDCKNKTATIILFKDTYNYLKKTLETYSNTSIDKFSYLVIEKKHVLEKFLRKKQNIV